MTDEFMQDPEDEAEALLDMDGRRERLERVVADLQRGKVQPVDHATAAARLRQTIAYLIGKDGGTFKFTITDIEPGDQS